MRGVGHTSTVAAGQAHPLIAFLAFAALVCGLFTMARPTAATSARRLQTSTWSIVAVEPMTGDVGVAAASCVPNRYADGLAALVPGKGTGVAQAVWTRANRNRVFQLLQEGRPADAIIRQVTDRRNDPSVGLRQYGVVALRDGVASAAAFTGKDNPPWAGDRQDLTMQVTAQGNTLVGERVVAETLRAFVGPNGSGTGTLPDRLVRALEAGSAAGGDSRCNTDQVRQTAATAFVLVALGTDAPYAAPDIGITDAGTPRAPWLAISVTERRFGANPVQELRRRYDIWRQTGTLPGPTAGPGQQILWLAGILALAFLSLGLFWVRRLARRGRGN